MTGYRMCTRCVMDTTDPEIEFDENGVCNHCHHYDEAMRTVVVSGDEGRRRLENIAAKIRRDGKDKDYDCVIGVSGGVDSTYAAFKVKELGLRPLAVHLDNGWDSELAVGNIHKALTRLNIDLHTHVIDWEEFKDLQLSFLKASTPDSEVPSDHAILALMYQMAERIGVKYVIRGLNKRTESHLPRAWSQGHMDWKYIKRVHRQFGKAELKTFPRMDFWTYRRYARTQEWIDILNYLDYVKNDAIQILERELDWKYYGKKHYESIYTRFYQGYILPEKFGYDKRKTHFSSLICSGEMTREEALKELKKETYPIEMQEEDKAYVIKKLCLTNDDFERIMSLPKKTYWDYPSYGKFYAGPVYRSLRGMYRLLKSGAALLIPLGQQGHNLR